MSIESAAVQGLRQLPGIVEDSFELANEATLFATKDPTAYSGKLVRVVFADGSHNLYKGVGASWIKQPTSGIRDGTSYFLRNLEGSLYQDLIAWDATAGQLAVDGIIQPRLITYNNPALIQDDLVFGDIATIDLTGTDAANPLSLRLPGGEVSDRKMEIVLQDIPSGSFGTGFLRLEALPNGATPVQILGPAGLTTDSIGLVSAQDLKGSEIHLVRAVGSDRWMMRSQLPGHTTDTWIGPGDPLLAPDPAFFTRWIVDDTNPGIVRFFDVNSQIWRDQ